MTAEMKAFKQNLYNKLDDMYVLMNVGMNRERLSSRRLKPTDNTHLILKTDYGVKNHIWAMVRSTIDYTRATAYKRGFQKGLIVGALDAKLNIAEAELEKLRTKAEEES